MIEVTMTDEIMDFSVPRKTVQFKIDDDVFEAPSEIAAELMLRFADDASALDADELGRGPTTVEQLTIMHNLMRMILLPESAERFIARLSDPARPIGIATFERVTDYLMEAYGLRPTEPDSPSSSGSVNPDTGTSSRESVNGVASTSVPSPTIAS